MNPRIDVVRAMKFPFDDEDWLVKVIVGSLVSLIPFFGAGYVASVARNVLRGDDRPLPATGDLGQVLTDGLMLTIAGIMYFFPVILLGGVFSIFMAIASDSLLGFLVGASAALCLLLVFVLYVVPVLGMYWMGIIRYAHSGNFSAFTQFGDRWQDARDNVNLLLTLLVYGVVLGFLAGIASTVLWVTCVGLFVLAFWQNIAFGHLVGQAALEVE
jgi:hypothetical protein